MSKFIELKAESGKRQFVNVDYIEEVVESDNGCTVYLAFSCPDACEQDYIVTDKPYDEVVSLILKGGAE